MIVEPTSNSPSPIERVLTTALLVENAPIGSNVKPLFDEFHSALWGFIEASNDPNIHVLAWNTIDQFAKADLAEYEVTKNGEALERLKEKVRNVLQLI